MSKLSWLLGIATLCCSSFAADVKPTIFRGYVFFSERPLAESNGRLVYDGTNEDFILANGQKVDASYQAPMKPFCIGCKDRSNTSEAALKMLGHKTEQVVESPQSKVQEPTKTSHVEQTALVITGQEAAWGGVRADFDQGRIAIYKADGTCFYRDEERQSYTISVGQSPCANGMCHSK